MFSATEREYSLYLRGRRKRRDIEKLERHRESGEFRASRRFVRATVRVDSVNLINEVNSNSYRLFCLSCLTICATNAIVVLTGFDQGKGKGNQGLKFEVPSCILARLAAVIGRADLSRRLFCSNEVVPFYNSAFDNSRYLPGEE